MKTIFYNQMHPYLLFYLFSIWYQSRRFKPCQTRMIEGTMTGVSGATTNPSLDQTRHSTYTLMTTPDKCTSMIISVTITTLIGQGKWKTFSLPKSDKLYQWNHWKTIGNHYRIQGMGTKWCHQKGWLITTMEKDSWNNINTLIPLEKSKVTSKRDLEKNVPREHMS